MIPRIPIRSASRCLSRARASPYLSRVVENFQAHGVGANNGRFRTIHTSPPLALGIFDDAKSFFSRLTLRAEASHILVKGTGPESLRKINDIKKEIGDDPEKFADAAAQNSDCPSGQQGGSLGEFGRYSMVPEFDKVVFNENVGVVHGPIETGFGYHLILIQRRND
uniref:Peptidyl-prolyl cis-trans isomerase n=1 Tax=Odontella aurita TaxID=265563 RepID=A0A6U6D7J0_9STRA|mmetsp:Transcript_18526/g.53415  ORF Transcript_18526/g.53415 Transcript_18526/m.53415 type:complete len:166 (+) Transcript_18526:209-706(+)|eukprot:CAMPEP_0113555460 /NCGR_PEP_ID=MMETSP0015_2-20120614/16725_1 /TAXON_ID=2838 /ORGANISM="Odontella" /LENGTH=165 /DNA_ID=CAMNT_0000456731 /DNA_START=174 /DNA_END=671 /DNA_ORIENTATION=- /assembly_acc=CAM_ASM_000160